MIDQYQNHSGFNYLCRYWKRDDRISDLNLDKYILSEDQKGIFYAKPIAPNTQEKQSFVGAFLFDSTSVMISTPDYNEVKSGDVVEYKGKVWRVVNSQFYEDDDTSEFGNPSGMTYIQLKK